MGTWELFECCVGRNHANSQRVFHVKLQLAGIAKTIEEKKIANCIHITQQYEVNYPFGLASWKFASNGDDGKRGEKKHTMHAHCGGGTYLFGGRLVFE